MVPRSRRSPGLVRRGAAVSRRLVVEADGGSRGNPGPAGYGAVVRDAVTGEVLAERAAGIGRATNNVAEYGGLIAGLTAAARARPGRGRGPDGLQARRRADERPLAGQAPGDEAARRARPRRSCAGCRGCASRWIPRAQNSARRPARQRGDGRRRARRRLARRRRQRPGRRRRRLARRARADRVPGAGAAPVATPQHGWRDDPSRRRPRRCCCATGRPRCRCEKRFSGTGDQPLTEHGRRRPPPRPRGWPTQRRDRRRQQSRCAGPARPPSSSPPRSASRSPFEPGLRETDFGDWEGYTFAEVQAEVAARARRLARPTRRWRRRSARASTRPTTRVRQARDRRARGVRRADASSSSATSRRSRRCCGWRSTRRRARCTGCTSTWRACPRCSGSPTVPRSCGR